MSEASDYIDAHFSETLDKLKVWCAQPSISTENVGVSEMAKLAASQFEERGYDVRVFQTPGFPVIVAEAGPEDAPSILIYNHYDVQPTGDLEEWTSPPFEPTVRDGKMYGRGVADTKSNIVARMEALNAVRTVTGELPVRVIWLLEGEEEIGSPHLDTFIAEHRDELRADGCIWEFGNYTHDGRPNIYLGLKGMLGVELVARHAARDLHSANAAIVTSPVWRLIWALNTIKGPDGKIQIPDFYADVAVPTEAQLEMLETLPDETEEIIKLYGIPHFLNGMTGKDVYKAASFDPTANIQGIEAGYNGPGSKTVLPKVAQAKLDIRLVPDQDPEKILASLQKFLNDKGFEDVEARRIANEGDLLPAFSDPASPFIQNVIRACREANGKEPVVTPSSAGSGPMASFTMAPPRGLGLPVAAFGTGHNDSRAHGPDENIRLDDMRAHMHVVARLVEMMRNA
jgi:acetylornithine deacetylase/succinyl-diaminopimelate desuccinylase-like protein